LHSNSEFIELVDAVSAHSEVLCCVTKDEAHAKGYFDEKEFLLTVGDAV